MRKLLNTLYVMTESCYLTLDGENIVILLQRDCPSPVLRPGAAAYRSVEEMYG